MLIMSATSPPRRPAKLPRVPKLATSLDLARNEAGYMREHAQILDETLRQFTFDVEDVLAIIDMLRKGADYIENIVLIKEVGPR